MLARMRKWLTTFVVAVGLWGLGMAPSEARQEDRGEEIKTVLNLLREGNISVEDAEKLIAALRR